jgi:hypothetical protein
MYVNFFLVMAVLNTAISVIATIFSNVTKSSIPGDTPTLISMSSSPPSLNSSIPSTSFSPGRWGGSKPSTNDNRFLSRDAWYKLYLTAIVFSWFWWFRS